MQVSSLGPSLFLHHKAIYLSTMMMPIFAKLKPLCHYNTNLLVWQCSAQFTSQVPKQTTQVGLPDTRCLTTMWTQRLNSHFIENSIYLVKVDMTPSSSMEGGWAHTQQKKPAAMAAWLQDELKMAAQGHGHHFHTSPSLSSSCQSAGAASTSFIPGLWKLAARLPLHRCVSQAARQLLSSHKHLGITHT